MAVRYERKARQSRAFLQFVLDHIKDGILILGADGNIVLRNAVAARLTASDAAAYKPVLEDHEGFAPDGRPLPVAEWPSSRALRGEFVRDFYMLYRHRVTGETGAREITTAPVPFLPGAVIISYRDDTRLQRVDEARMRLAEIVESSDDAIIAKDTRGIVRSWNKGAERIFGYTAAEMIGKSIKELIPASLCEQEDLVIERLKRGESIDHFDTTRLAKDGRVLQVSVSISPIRDVHGRVVGASKIARDMTATRTLERQLRQSQKMEAIGQLTGGIAHDFNNLLGIILGNLEMLEQDIAEPVVNADQGQEKTVRTLKRTATAERAARRAADLTRRLLAFSAGDDQMKPVATHLEHAIRNTLEMAGPALGPEIEVISEFEPQLAPVFVDPTGLVNALLNLVVNARDAMPKGGVLRLRAYAAELEERVGTVRSHELPPGRYACVAVSDNGTGMSRETVEHVFEPFFTTKPRSHGTGLGLAMVYGFLTQFNGSASVYSEPGYGTTVSLYLPFAQPGARKASRPEHAVAHHGGATILLVDDEPDLLEVATGYLRRLGYTAISARNGPEALRMLDETPHIDLLITDIIMPGGMNGVELVQRLRELRPGTRCIYTSGFPADALAHKRLELADCTLLHKPYRLAELHGVIKLALHPLS